MIDRRQVLAGAVAGVAAPGLARAARGWAARDLDGCWNGASYTQLERPDELPRLVLTAAEAEAWEAPRRALRGMPPSKVGGVGQNESEFNERGTGR